ncbi:BRO1-like domain-containing protein, partial [Parasitella parasitica]
MMAQAHECIWQKAVMEHLKHGTVARLAVKVADLYDAFLSGLHDEKMIPDYWIRYAKAKSNYFQAVAQYQKANEAISNGRYGEEIARLRLAKASVTAALSQIRALQPSFANQLATLDQLIGCDLIRAEKDNDVVYMETVPEASQLAPILRSDMVTPNVPNFISHPNYWLVLPDRPNDKLFIKRPLFDNLVPFAVHQAKSVFSDKKDYIIKVDIVGKNQELNADKKKCLDEMKLPYALDIVDALPAKLVEYAEEVQDEGGIQSLNDMLFKIQSMSDKTLKLIDEGFNALEEENEQDATLSRQYGK